MLRGIRSDEGGQPIAVFGSDLGVDTAGILGRGRSQSRAGSESPPISSDPTTRREILALSILIWTCSAPLLEHRASPSPRCSTQSASSTSRGRAGGAPSIGCGRREVCPRAGMDGVRPTRPLHAVSVQPGQCGAAPPQTRARGHRPDGRECRPRPCSAAPPARSPAAAVRARACRPSKR
jgi:hypothetical protein